MSYRLVLITLLFGGLAARWATKPRRAAPSSAVPARHEDVVGALALTDARPAEQAAEARADAETADRPPGRAKPTDWPAEGLGLPRTPPARRDH